VGDGDTVTEVGGKTGGVDLVQSSVSFVLGDFIENLTLTGTAAIDGTGNGLANILRGNAGINHLAGGDGADTYYVGAEDFVIEANATGGVDIVYASGSFALGANVENLTLVAGAGNIDGAGNSLANILTGNEGNNRLDGGAGIDTMTGGLGNDVYVVDSLSDKIVESAAISGGVDTIESSITYSIAAKALAGIENLTLTGTGDFNATGNGLANTLTGNTGANILDGGAGNDALNGGDGNDTLIGGIGADTLTGGLGADDFVLNAAAIYDTITDFSAADGDQIQLENAVFKALGATNNVPLADVQFHIGAAATDQFQHIIYNETTGALYYDADGSGAGAMIQIAALAPAITIDHTNFMVI
jgi:Ca2+-binding RTX toxin-like protein